MVKPLRAHALKILCLLVLAVFVHMPSYAQSADDKVFGAETFHLENGLEIVVIPNHRAPVVTHMVWYMAGAADEPSGQSGIAHFLEHLMFKGSSYINENGETVVLAPGEFSYLVKSLGGQHNAFTSQDYTAYFESIASEHLETVMRLEAGRMRGLSPPAEEVESERKVILEERRQRTDNDPRSAFQENVNAALYVNHPYGTPIIGWEHEMEKLTWDSAKAFYDQHYAPNNAILVVAGDVTGAQVYELAQKIYGAIEAVNVPPRDWPHSPPLTGEITVKKHDGSINQPEVEFVVRAPGYKKNVQDALALEVLNNIIAGGASSRIYQSLVVDQKIATSAGLSYNPNSQDDAEIWLYATPSPDKEPEDVIAALQKEIEILVQDGVTETELKEAITRMQDSAAFARDSLTGPAMTVGGALASGTRLETIEYWPDAIAGVTVADIQRVAEHYLHLDTEKQLVVSGYLLPEAQEAKDEDPVQ